MNAINQKLAEIEKAIYDTQKSDTMSMLEKREKLDRLRYERSQIDKTKTLKITL